MPREFPPPAETANGRQRRSHARLSGYDKADDQRFRNDGGPRVRVETKQSLSDSCKGRENESQNHFSSQKRQTESVYLYSLKLFRIFDLIRDAPTLQPYFRP
jgi:hypothetical protein